MPLFALQVPLQSTLAFGGVGGLALGLSARDIAANFLGGMLLLFNEPFTPGDMVKFSTRDCKVRCGVVMWSLMWFGVLCHDVLSSPQESPQ